MKSYLPTRRLTALLVLGLAVGCDGVTVPDPDASTFVGNWEGSLWIGDASAFLGSDGVLYVFGSAPRGAAFNAEETVTARVSFTGPGVYPLAPEDVYFNELTGGDVVDATYVGSGQPAGVLRVTRYDASSGAIEGELEFRGTTTSANASYGQSARLEDGKFRARVETAAP